MMKTGEVDIAIWAESPFGTMYRVGTVAVAVTADSKDGVKLDIESFTDKLTEALDDAE